MTYKVKDGARDKGQKDKSYEDEESNLMVIEFVGVEDVLIHKSSHLVAVVYEINSKGEGRNRAHKL